MSASAHDAALDSLAETAHDASLDELVDRSHAHRNEPDANAADAETYGEPSGALAVLRKGIAVMPEVRVGIRVSLAFAVLVAAGKLLIPVVIQQVLDRGVLGKRGFQAGFVITACVGTDRKSVV